MNVLITGGSGFIGYHLAKQLLEQGHRVILVDNLSRGVNDPALTALLDLPDASFLAADLLDPKALDGLGMGVDWIFHMAAIIGVQNVLNRPASVLWDNVQLLKNLLDFAGRQPGLQRFIFPSTSEVYAGTLKHFNLPIPTPESTPLATTALDHPRTSYMLSKIYGEAMCQHSGLPFTIVRPHNVYGPRMGLSHVIPQLLQRAYAAAEGDELMVYSPTHKRTFCYIDDAVNLLVALAGSEQALNGTFNLGAPFTETEIFGLAEQVLAVVGKQLTLVKGEDTPGSPTRRCPDMTASIAASGFTPSISLEEGVERTFAWYREQVFDGEGVSAL